MAIVVYVIDNSARMIQIRFQVDISDDHLTASNQHTLLPFLPSEANALALNTSDGSLPSSDIFGPTAKGSSELLMLLLP